MAEIPTQTLAESSGDAVGQVTRGKDPVAEVAKLLSVPAAAPEPTPETGTPADPPSESWDLKSLAEKLGTDPAKLYEGLKVSLADGSEMTVSALKDAYKPAAELEKARTELLGELSASKREVLHNRQELGILVRELQANGTLTEPVAREVARMAEQERATEAERLLQRLPEWKDPITRAADWAGMRKTGAAYGFSEAEIRAAEAGYVDHRLIALLRDSSRTPKAEKATKVEPKVAVKPAGSGRTQAQQFGQLKAAVKTGRTSPFSAVEQLLKG